MWLHVCAVNSGAGAPVYNHTTTKTGGKREIQRADFPFNKYMLSILKRKPALLSVHLKDGLIVGLIPCFQI